MGVRRCVLRMRARVRERWTGSRLFVLLKVDLGTCWCCECSSAVVYLLVARTWACIGC